MKVVPYDESNWVNDHPTGNLPFQHMLKGEPGTQDNFHFLLARQDGDFHMPRHRHNFEQIRLPLNGDMNLGKLTLGEGQVGYFPEGGAYGPQDDPLGKTQPGVRVQLALQFGGASNYGFMSMEQRRAAIKGLAPLGKMVGPNFQYNDGKLEWGLNPIWKHIFGVRLKYPRSRYKDTIIADPKNFNWLQLTGSPGVDHKFMGAFSERGVWIEMIRLKAGATWTSTDPRARRLFFVLHGDGAADESVVGKWSALQVDAQEVLSLHAKTAMELFLIGLPPIEMPAVEGNEEQFDYEEMPPALREAE